MRSVLLWGICWLLFSGSAGALDRPVGSVKTYRQEVVVVRAGDEGPLELGGKVYSGDLIKTGSSGSVGIIFVDGSVLSLGPETEFVIEDFRFEPAAADVSLLTRMQRGTLSFISGAIGRISPKSVQFKTPTATLGLRGTKVLIKVD